MAIKVRAVQTVPPPQTPASSAAPPDSYMTILGPIAPQKKEVGGQQVSADMTTFIREQDIAIYATGLRPSTRMYVFFDGIRIWVYNSSYYGFYKNKSFYCRFLY